METVRFDELELQPQILRGIKAMGFEEATPIQSQAIPVVMSGSDVIGQAQTGTGKTAAFGIPILQTVDPSNKKTQVIILSPTREPCSGKIYARCQGASGLWRSGDQQADPLVKRRSTDHHRYTGKSYGSPSQKNDPL